MSPHYTPEGEEPDAKFYVYELLRPDGRPFYVGKGKGRRMFEHDYEARRGCDCYKCNVIRKIWREGGQVGRHVLFRTDGEHEAFEVEREWIAHYGRRNLTNAIDGGRGVTRTQKGRQKKRKISLELAVQVRFLWNDRLLSYPRIARDLGLSAATVAKAVKRQGVYADDP